MHRHRVPSVRQSSENRKCIHQVSKAHKSVARESASLVKNSTCGFRSVLISSAGSECVRVWFKVCVGILRRLRVCKGMA